MASAVAGHSLLENFCASLSNSSTSSKAICRRATPLHGREVLQCCPTASNVQQDLGGSNLEGGLKTIGCQRDTTCSIATRAMRTQLGPAHPMFNVQVLRRQHMRAASQNLKVACSNFPACDVSWDVVLLSTNCRKQMHLVKCRHLPECKQDAFDCDRYVVAST